MLLNIKTFVSSINYSWLNFKLQTQIILAATILILVFFSSIFSWPINTIQVTNTNINRGINDLNNTLLYDNIRSLSKENKISEIIPFCERFYKNSTTIKSIIFIDQKGTAYGIPYKYSEIVSRFNRFIPFPNSLFFSGGKMPFNGIVRALTVENFPSLLIINNSSNFILLNDGLIKNEVILLIFTVVLILIYFFVKLTLSRPIKEVSRSLLSIAAGNFSNRITLRFGGELGALISSVNELGRHLQLYDEKKNAQLLNEKIKLESLIATITDGVLLLDANLRIVVVNTMAIKIFSWKTKTRLLGTSIWEHLPLSLQKKLFVTLQDILFETQSAVFDGKFDNDLVQGPQQSVRIMLNIVYDSLDIARIPVGIVLTIQDMTKVFELDKTQNRFISNISHELRTPLFNIKSFIETVQEYEYTLSTWQKRYFLDIVNEETNRLTRLVNDILCISKLDSSKSVPFGAMNIVEVIIQTISNYQLVARDKSLYLHSEILALSLIIQGNSDLLFQVLTNLVGNALKFTYKMGEIIIRVYPICNQKVRVEIADTGIGISYSYQQYIFQRFYRVDNQVHTLKGTGLGLFLVDTILYEHKTNIQVVSHSGVGSVFWFDLPSP